MGCAPSREKEIKAIEEEIASKEKTIADLQAAADKKTAMLRKLDEALILSVMPRTVEDIEQLDAKMKAVRKTAFPARRSRPRPALQR